MLQTLREKTTGWVATLVLGLLIIPFAFVGVNDYLTGGADNSAARVQAPPSWWKSAPTWWPVSKLWETEEISVDEFRTAFEQARQQQRQIQGEAFDARGFETADNKRKVLEQLIDQRAMLLAARLAGIEVSDVAVQKSISEETAFQVDGKFNPDTYVSILQMNNMTPVGFQQRERERLQSALLPLGIGDSEFVTAKEAERLMKLLGETRDVVLGLMPPPPADEGEVADADVNAWYDEHTADFMKPETVTLEYIDLDGAALPAPEAPSEESLRQRYEQEQTRFMSNEQRLASHILIAVPADADAATREAAEKKAAALVEQARQPDADFAALAKANSEDPGSASSGGDLGWVEKGIMVKPFEDALFAMQPGEVRGPVQTQFGYHVLKLNEIKAGSGKSFDEVRDELLREETEAQVDRSYNDLAGSLVTEVLKNPASLEPAAATLGLKVQTLGPFSRNDASGIAATPEVLRQAFSESLIEDGTASDPIEIGSRHSVVIRVTGHTDAQARPLQEVRDDVIAAIRADRQSKAAAAAADAVVERVRKGESLQEVAKAEKFMANAIPGLPRGTPMPSAEANEAIFAAPQPEEGKPSAGKSDLGDGRYLVFQVEKVNEGDLEQVTDEQRQQLQQQIRQIRAGEATQSYVEQLRKQFTITVHEDRL
ncbi:peptidylprolyl isomerase [Pseudoxanthomonas kalamensis DSM 18571]|uniref:SurA N-terminal domain-containing protein n=1 Tax=Pseudoxanthomonas kalamensis TaxID=289483 RepID=UPI001391065F|nr:SurA N-terminal domain-containing protein [Pseudoxanthomonas kalamensis]KAF1710436.1 peptidylprolyl isomerase [Pseudoxanthomonas kalamensis DSM 18571]